MRLAYVRFYVRFADAGKGPFAGTAMAESSIIGCDMTTAIGRAGTMNPRLPPGATALLARWAAAWGLPRLAARTRVEVNPRLRRGPLPRVRAPRRPGPPPPPHGPPRSQVEGAHGPGRLHATRTARPRRRPPGRSGRSEAARPPLPPPLPGLPREPDGPPPHARLAVPRVRRGRPGRGARHREPPGAVPSAPRTLGG